ncbi:Beta-galactosidase BoGH2A [Pontiella desulfatans]|uniref:Beta-galactosidase BoGH2A n=1 Tax=Pontiella desulfatans TaxID=2750659 RepID=A0A6C2U2G5_PONDE|nr:glycoside hydrolase family 2 protein [Pontiella desulfatans]VGO14178.1 Beta-galactosidase BoGH2A [Pontiella desulfatans]
MKKTAIMIFTAVTALTFGEDSMREFSTAGFHRLEGGGRDVYNFNVGWRFYKGSVEGAEKAAFDDAAWAVVNCPHGLELLPDDASGSINYQGEAWYRKHFEVPVYMKGRRIVLHFEAIMGKSKIWINGALVKEQLGGFLPIVIDVTDVVKHGAKNVVTVLADNSDDPAYPPGKPQEVMDFTYFGGIYRDVWFYSTAPVYITDPNQVDVVAGGGVFAHVDKLSDDTADVSVSTHVANTTSEKQRLTVSSTIIDAEGTPVGKREEPLEIEAGQSATVTSFVTVAEPNLWHPDDPYLYRLVSRVLKDGKVVDGFKTKIGIRTIEFRGTEGFFLNGKPFEDKLMGANRHQDFAYIGNALPNSLHWRDAKKLRNAGLRIVRSAHYPQDPAFMDACNELGLFVIVATPGWQFWNNDPVFAERVYSDIRNMVRRDRNHPSVILWEPILNETHYPDSFAKIAHDITHEEYPFSGCYTAADGSAKGSGFYDVIYSGSKVEGDKAVFTREWGDNVDDWSSHNSPSRVHRSWGETPMLVQAKSYADPRPLYYYGCWEKFYDSPRQLVGGCLWHSFDHYRGYHPDNFYGGIMDPFRQPKYSYYLFQSQRDANLNVPNIENGSMVYIANEMTPFSSQDVRVFSNCEEVRLTVFGKVLETKRPKDSGQKMPSPPIEFEDAYNFMQLRALHRAKKFDEACIVAEGLIDGKVVASHARYPAKRPARLKFSIDFDGIPLVADGSDIVTVIASLVDEQGNVKRLGKERIGFEVEGEGVLLGNHLIGANPRELEWGTAPCLIRSTGRPGKITVRAMVFHEGLNTPLAGEITFESVSPTVSALFSEEDSSSSFYQVGLGHQSKDGASKAELEDIGAQQSEFEHY